MILVLIRGNTKWQQCDMLQRSAKIKNVKDILASVTIHHPRITVTPEFWMVLQMYRKVKAKYCVFMIVQTLFSLLI